MIRQIEIIVILIILIVIVIVTNIGTWYFTHQHDQNRMYAVQIDTANAVQGELIKQQELTAKRIAIINQSQVQHDKDQVIINQLADNLKRLQIHGICGGIMQTGAIATGNQNTGAWIFSETVDANFARLQQRTSELFRQCDQINVDSIRQNSQIVGIAPLM